MLYTLQAGGGRLRWRPFSKQPWVIIQSNILPPCWWAPVLLSGGEWASVCFTSGWKESFQANSLVHVQFTWGNDVSSVFFFPCFKMFYVDFVNEKWSVLIPWKYSMTKKLFSAFLKEKRSKGFIWAANLCFLGIYSNNLVPRPWKERWRSKSR